MKVSLANSVRDGKNINRKKEMREYPDSQLDFWIRLLSMGSCSTLCLLMHVSGTVWPTTTCNYKQQETLSSVEGTKGHVPLLCES